jgi:hypothetical protein
LIEYKSPLAICDKGGFAFDYVEGAILGPMKEGFSMMMLVGAGIPENQAKRNESATEWRYSTSLVTIE